MEEGEVTDANVLIQAGQLGHLLRRQFKVKDIQILLKAIRIRALGNGGHTSIDDPAEQHLGWRLAMGGGDLLDLRDVHQIWQIPHDAGTCVKLGDSLGSQRGVGGNGHFLGLAKIDQITLLQINMVFDLVCGRADLAVL